MYVLILTANSGLKSLLQYVLSKENCASKTTRNVTDLLTAIRYRVPDCIILDRDFFPPSDTEGELENYICTSPFFIKFDFLMFLYEKDKPETLLNPIFQGKFCDEQSKERIHTMMKSLIPKITYLQQTPPQFRPIEKKLYNLLKDRAEKALTLEDMSYTLWGTRTAEHKKTLYTYIHRIKHILRESEDRPEMLVKAKKGCYKLIFYP